MTQLTGEVTELINVIGVISKRWPGPGAYGIAEHCTGFYKSLLLLMDNPINRGAVEAAWADKRTYEGASSAVAKRAVELGAPVATVNFLIAVHFGA